jgi:hypothetical protein
MKVSFAAVIVSALGLAGCTTLPKSVEHVPISAKDIFDAVDCDLKDLLEQPQLENTTLGKWSGVANINVLNTGDLKIDAGADFTTTLQTPLAPVTVKLSPAGGYETKSIGTLKLARDYPKLSSVANASCPPADSPLSAHGLGITEALVAQFAFAGNDPGSKDITSLGFQRTYTVSRSAGGGLSFTVGMVKLTANGNKASNEIATTIIVSIQPPKPTSDKGDTKEIQDRIDQEQRDQLLRDAVDSAAL